PSTGKQPASLSLPPCDALDDFCKRVMNDEQFEGVFRKLEKPYSAGFYARRTPTPEAAEYCRLIEQATRYMLSDPQNGGSATPEELEALKKKDFEAAIMEALKNPIFSVRALVVHLPRWAMLQPRIADFVGRLLWIAHHGKGGKNSDAAKARKILETLLLPKRDRGGSPDSTDDNIRSRFTTELQRIRKVVDGCRKLLCAEWETLKKERADATAKANKKRRASRKPELHESELCPIDRLMEELAIRHTLRCG